MEKGGFHRDGEKEIPLKKKGRTGKEGFPGISKGENFLSKGKEGGKWWGITLDRSGQFWGGRIPPKRSQWAETKRCIPTPTARIIP